MNLALFPFIMHCNFPHSPTIEWGNLIISIRYNYLRIR